MQYINLFDNFLTENNRPKFIVRTNKAGTKVFLMKLGDKILLECLAQKQDETNINLSNIRIQVADEKIKKEFLNKIINYYSQYPKTILWIRADLDNINLYKKIGFKERDKNFPTELEEYKHSWMYLEIE